MVDILRDTLNFLSQPTIYFTACVVGWWWLMKYYPIWTEPKVMKWVGVVFTIVILLALLDPNFRKEALKPDNVPIWIMTYGVGFFFWLAMRRGYLNDQLMAEGKPNLEKQESDKKVYTWPDLVYSELICMVLFTAFLIAWSIILKAPLEDPANAGVTPAVAKAPWYFLGLQEMLVYYDPWMAGVILPTLIIVGLVAMPYFDVNPKGNGYYTIKERFGALWIWGFGFVVLWIALIFLGTFMRGPGWNFFGPFEYWDTHKVEAASNINLSELVWVKLLNIGLPNSILLREFAGILLCGAYLVVVPKLLMKKFPDLYEKMGAVRFHLVMQLVLIMSSLPIKMYLRWVINLKYIVAIPEYMFNI
jgi:hypothetical protein